jgi:hypothetical protein
MKILSSILILITVYLSAKHGWGGITGNVKPEEAAMMDGLGISRPVLNIISVASLAVAVLVLFPQTFFVGNVLNAITILLIMAYAFQSGNLRIALIEVPFLLMPLALIWLKHPLAK